jgi:hypothetical protein
MKRPIKICQNPECDEEITVYKSAKRKYCDDQCRRRAWYINQQIEYKDYNEWLKDNKEQLKIIELFVLQGKRQVRQSTLEDLGLNLDLWQIPERDSRMKPTYRIGRYKLIYNKESKTFTIKTKEYETEY